MRSYLLLILLFFLITSCGSVLDKKVDSYDLIPDESRIVISIKNLNKFKSSINNNDYLASIVASDSTLNKMINSLELIDSNSEILIGIYGKNNKNYVILGEEILKDSISFNYYNSYKNIDVISNNEIALNETGNDHFIQKFKKLNLTNTNFSIAVDSGYTNDFLNKFLDKKNLNHNSNLILNISATKNVILMNGVIDNLYVETNENDNLLKFEEIKYTERELYFDIEKELSENYDILRTNQEKKIIFFNYEKENSKKYKVFQFKNGDNILNVNGIISEFKSEISNSVNNLKFEIRFPNEIILGPIMVKNHITNKNEIIVQDSENNIHLINNNGQIEWTKKIKGKIINEIHQIDSYNNGKLQYVFVTENELYMIDRKGRNVGKFPLKFNDKITKPISVFDYDKNKNYRLLVTQSNELFMFDSKGKMVKGFNYEKNGEIINKPKHFRIGNKDIIVFKTSKQLSIINRRGRIRIKTDKNYNFSKDDVFRHKNILVTTTKKNEIVKIKMDGKTTLENSMPFNSKIISDKNNIFKLQKNIVSNPNYKKEIQFGKYDDFKIFDFNKNYFLSIYDSQNKNLYLLNEKLEINEGFPMKSEGKADFSNNDGQINFAFKSESQKIKFFSFK